MNVLLVGGEAAGVRLLRALAGAGGRHRLVGVMAEPGPGGVWGAALEAGLRTWPAALVGDPAFAATVRAEGVDLLLNAHSLRLVRPEVLAAARVGAFNLHPGPLPRYAGLNGPSWALYRDEPRYGVAVHWMDAGLDTGPIAYREEFGVGPADTGLTLSARCVRHGLPLALRLVETAAADPGAIPRLPNDPALRERFGREVPRGGWIGWARPAAEVANLVRACDYHPFPSPWGRARTLADGVEVGVAAVRRTGEPASAAPGAVVGVGTDGSVRVACWDEDVLVTRLAAGDRAVPAAGVLRPGQRLGGPPPSG
jgi:methionyl-tRNA formyltransferase